MNVPYIVYINHYNTRLCVQSPLTRHAVPLTMPTMPLPFLICSSMLGPIVLPLHYPLCCSLILFQGCPILFLSVPLTCHYTEPHKYSLGCAPYYNSSFTVRCPLIKLCPFICFLSVPLYLTLPLLPLLTLSFPLFTEIFPPITVLCVVLLIPRSAPLLYPAFVYYAALL